MRTLLSSSCPAVVEEQVQQHGGHAGDHDPVTEDNLELGWQVLKDVGIHGDPEAQTDRDGGR